MSTTLTFSALITVTAVELQMFGGETCHVHVKVDRAGHENNRKNLPSQCGCLRRSALNLL